jgi:hypothetical protein
MGSFNNYWPNTLRIDDVDIQLAFSWRGHVHLSWLHERLLVLLVPALVEGLCEVWDRFTADLVAEPSARAAARISLEKRGRVGHGHGPRASRLAADSGAYA